MRLSIFPGPPGDSLAAEIARALTRLAWLVLAVRISLGLAGETGIAQALHWPVNILFGLAGCGIAAVTLKDRP